MFLPTDILGLIYEYHHQLCLHEVHMRINLLYRNARNGTNLGYLTEMRIPRYWDTRRKSMMLKGWDCVNTLGVKFSPQCAYRFYCGICGSLQEEVIEELYFKCKCGFSYSIDNKFNHCGIFGKLVYYWDLRIDRFFYRTRPKCQFSMAQVDDDDIRQGFWLKGLCQLSFSTGICVTKFLSYTSPHVKALRGKW